MALAQNTQEKVREYRRRQRTPRFSRNTWRCSSIPNVASDIPNIRKNAEFIAEMMKQRGLRAASAGSDQPRTSAGRLRRMESSGRATHILLYAHYDGQPTDPKQWTGTHPWKPVFRNAAIESGGQIVPSRHGGQRTFQSATGASTRALLPTTKPA